MFDWFRPKSFVPTVSKANPGRGVSVQTAFSNAERNWTEELDLPDCLAAIVEPHGLRPTRHKGWLELDCGLFLLPQLVSLQPLDRGGVQTLTTIEVVHERLIPSGVFEYQHSTGDDLKDSISKGFDGWEKLDLPVFIDALRKELTACSALEMSFPAKPDRRALKRRVVLGPTGHLAAQTVEHEEEHPFCPCCLFTNSLEAFREFLESDRFYGVRLFAMRDADGAAQADCRVNGEDWNPGKEAFIRYAATWPPRGFEFRKQFIAIHSLDAKETTE